MKKGAAVIQIRIITGVILFLSLVLIGRLYYIQVMQRDFYSERAERQYVHTVDDLYSRGSIFFTTKDGQHVSAATIQAGYQLVMNPTRITDAEVAYEKLSTVIDLNREHFMARSKRTDSVYQVLKSQITTTQADAIEALKIPGIAMYREQWRFYPGETLSARTVGFVGQTVDSDSLVGRYGLERYYDDILVRDSSRMTVNFFAEIFSNLGSVMFDTTEARTGDVVTSIEPTVARMLDLELEKTQNQWNSKLTGGIIMDPQTGKIIAMSVFPHFNINDRAEATIEDFRNPLVEDVYEFGSTIKALTIAAGLDSGAVTPRTTYYDSGRLALDTFTISNYDGKGRGTVDMQQVLNQSLNTGVAYVVDTMGKDVFRKYFKSFKFGSETGIDLPNETYGLISNLDSPRDIEYATASYGQGIAMTPIATARALATLGNGGRLVNPHIATQIKYQDGSVKDIKFPKGEQVFSAETSETVSRMLTAVVDEALSGGKMALPNYTVAAKTGTAQIADPYNGGYYDDRYLHSFFGYFPAYEPKYLIFLYTVEPKGVRYASETLTVPFFELTKFLINYYNLPPDR